MAIVLTTPQATLLGELQAAGDAGVFKSTGYTPAQVLIRLGLARWVRKFNNGTSGCLVITEKGLKFRRGEKV